MTLNIEMQPYGNAVRSSLSWSWRTPPSFLSALALVLFTACGSGPRAPGDADEHGEAGPTCHGEQTCSGDLHDVLCDGNFLERCSPGLGCGGNGTCVPVCQAAIDNGSTIGCEYYVVAPDVISVARNACFAAFIANTWDSPISISVERDGQTFPIPYVARVPHGQGAAVTYAPLSGDVLGSDEVAIVFLAGSGCPNGAGSGIVDAAAHGTGYGNAFRITTSAPVVAYDIYPYGGGSLALSSATLLLPTSAWGTNYVGVNAFRKSVRVQEAQPSMAIVGSEDDTTVTILPKAAIAGGPNVVPAPQDVASTYSVARGQVLQFTQDAELSGTVIESDKPVGLWGGATCLSIDVNDGACDSSHQQIPSVKALGHRYAAVRHRNRFAGQEETVPWRFVGAVNGTTLTYLPQTPLGAPTVLARGQVAEFWTPDAFTVQSQDSDHPFYVSAHMTGCGRVSGTPPPPPAAWDCRGDPEFVNVIPLDQYLASYTFFTDPTFPETNLVLVREKKNGVFADVAVDCSGIVSGWTPIDASGEVEYARIDLVTGDFSPVGNCNNGLHLASSTQPFGLVIWGWGTAATSTPTTTNSYAYPAGASLKPINSVVVEIL